MSNIRTVPHWVSESVPQDQGRLSTPHHSVSILEALNVPKAYVNIRWIVTRHPREREGLMRKGRYG